MPSSAVLQHGGSRPTGAKGGRDGPPETSNFPKIGAPALRALYGAGYTRLEQLTQVSEAELGKLHGMGPKALSILKEALAFKR